MSKQLCQCGNDLNLGIKSTAKFGVAKKIGFMEIKDDQGADNFLDLTPTWDTAFWNARLAEDNFSQRLLLTPEIEDYTFSITDPNTVTRGSGKVVNLGGGNVKSYEFFIDDADGTMFDALDALSCKTVGVFVIDDCGSVGGNECVTDQLSPKQVTTMNVQMMDAFDGDTQRVKVTYSLTLSETQTWDIVEVSDQDNTILDLNSPYDAVIVGVGAGSQTTVTFDLKALSSFAKKDIPAEGLTETADWTITDSAEATSNPSTVVENSAGNYTLVYASIAVGAATFKFLDNVAEAIVPVAIT